ncbi:hypothetical protein CIL05_07345 [Virgibacillus profundi]|uniref:Uncharacterized protein n=1 Tax=Virgibacillus profundi TaxID=2024555 RepID=A0A2A2IGL6_9BACI|nr:hypothetical protein [Virgibacillus profundi]PAV30275.1 hypothetical protein CIL05_07345 [Virgibacillus profundi]PXY54447.1 hypothetical protein CIT14_07430 [Virgibacillus profundi]
MKIWSSNNKNHKQDFTELLRDVLTNKDTDNSDTPQKCDYVTVVDNDTGAETSGRIVDYTKDSIVLKTITEFDAHKVHFK